MIAITFTINASALTIVIAVGLALTDVPAAIPLSVPSAYCVVIVAHGNSLVPSANVSWNSGNTCANIHHMQSVLARF